MQPDRSLYGGERWRTQRSGARGTGDQGVANGRAVVEQVSQPRPNRLQGRDGQIGERRLERAETLAAELGHHIIDRSVGKRGIDGHQIARLDPVGKLGKGDAVEVIEDNGAGWVRFRSVDGSESGWMADFLLSNG